MDKRAAGQYLDTLYGTAQGHVAVAYKDKGSSWQETQFAWPRDRAKILGWAQVHQDANIFICPALRIDPHTRKKGDGTALRWLWADVDWQGVPHERRAEIEARIKDLGSLVILSGSGTNVHVYVQLTHAVSGEEFAKLNTGLRDYLLADNKQADNSLLRLPGTTNWKTEEGSAVKISSSIISKQSPAALMKRRAFRDAKVSVDVEGSAWEFVEVEGLPRRMRAKLEMSVDEARARYGSRHLAVLGVVRDLLKYQMGPDEIHSLMGKYPAALSKAAEENGYDIHLDIDRILARTAKVQAEAEQLVNDDDDMPEVSEEEHRQELITEGVTKELLRRDIRRHADMLEAIQGHTEPPDDASESLSDALSTPAEPVQYLIDGLVSATGTVVITGQYKSGKTHLMVASLITALADDEPFLGSRAVHVPEGGVVVGHWNLEMSRLDLIDKYMRPAQFKNPKNVQIAHWQGYRVNLLTPLGKAGAIEWLKQRSVKVWTIDSWSQLCRMSGVDPNDNKEVGDLLDAVTEIKIQCGIEAVFLLAHTARSSSDNDKPGTRGASALDEGVDTRWMFTVDKSEVRWLQAEGRGTQMTGVSLDFDEETGRSVIGAVSRQSAAQDGMVQLIVHTLKDAKVPLNKGTLMAKVKEVKRVSNRAVDAGIVEALEGDWIIKHEGVGRNHLYSLAQMEAPDDGGRTRRATPGEVNLSGVSMRKPRSRTST